MSCTVSEVAEKIDREFGNKETNSTREFCVSVYKDPRTQTHHVTVSDVPDNCELVFETVAVGKTPKPAFDEARRECEKRKIYVKAFDVQQRA